MIFTNFYFIKDKTKWYIYFLEIRNRLCERGLMVAGDMCKIKEILVEES